MGGAGTLASEIREIEMLIGSTRSEVARVAAQEEQARAAYEAAKSGRGGDPFGLADAYLAAAARRISMEGHLGTLEAKSKLLQRVHALVVTPQGQPRDGAKQDDARILQAVVATQEEERRRIARQVHDGPAQSMANVVLQSEISERLFSIDAGRSREELAALRSMVNKTLQELRGFIFELRPMILDDLGLVPTLRRYIQTVVEKYAVRIDFSSTGRDRRLPSDREVAIFRLIQDMLIERIDRGKGKAVQLTTAWHEDALEIALQGDGRELPADDELPSGLRRSERLELLGGEARQGRLDGGISVVEVRIPIAAQPNG